MRRWFRFFLGTPERFLATLTGVGVIICLARPELFAQALNRAMIAIITAVQPLIGPALAVIIVFAGLRMILFGRGKK